jgi:hypothetical protein
MNACAISVGIYLKLERQHWLNGPGAAMTSAVPKGAVKIAAALALSKWEPCHISAASRAIEPKFYATSLHTIFRVPFTSTACAFTARCQSAADTGSRPGTDEFSIT